MRLFRCTALIAVLAGIQMGVGAGRVAGQSPVGRGPADVLRENRVLTEGGDQAGALNRLESFLARPSGNTHQPDLAVLRLEAARAAAATRQPDRARVHLVVAEQITAGPTSGLSPCSGHGCSANWLACGSGSAISPRMGRAQRRAADAGARGHRGGGRCRQFSWNRTPGVAASFRRNFRLRAQHRIT